MTTSSDQTIGRGLRRAVDSPADPVTDADLGTDCGDDLVELRRLLQIERERSLNVTDRVLGAQAEAAQARAEIKELQYRLHVREAELANLTELLDQREETTSRPDRPDEGSGRWPVEIVDRVDGGLRRLVKRIRGR